MNHIASSFTGLLVFCNSFNIATFLKEDIFTAICYLVTNKVYLNDTLLKGTLHFQRIVNVSKLQG